ncbi:MAG: cytochrome b/b6 domain-containing protein [Pseudomonadales bacterium]
MTDISSDNKTLQHYSVWDRTTRWFHWINVVCVLSLMVIGFVIFNGKVLGVSGDGKILLKTIHVYIGYVFAVNLVWRLIWGFIGNKYARWKAILPAGKGYWCSVKAYLVGAKRGEAPQYLGHNPVGRLMVTFLFLLLTTQAVTGFVLAGTDLYFPPFGNQIAEWVAEEGSTSEDIANLKPGSKEGVSSEAYAEMRSFRKPIITTHMYVFFTLLVAVFLHVVAVIVTEVREGNGLISAMFTGKKVVIKKPVDLDFKAKQRL